MLKGAFTAVLALVAAMPAPAQDAGLRGRVDAALAQAAAGTRFGLLVVDEQGREVIVINPDQRFIPASNTKMYTTAAAYATLPDMTGPDTTGGAAVRLEGRDVVLIGNGDARLSSADDCAVDCLATLADAIATKTKVVGNIIGDDTLFPDQRWGPGMSWNNIPTRSGTGISALTLDDNELPVTVGTDGKATLPAYYSVDNRVTVVPGAKSDIGFDRDPNGYVLRLTGTIGADAKPEQLRVGIDDPARYAAWRLGEMLKVRGVKVTGKIDVRHRVLTAADDPAIRGAALPARPPAEPVLAKLIPPPLADDVVLTNKVSQNLHADLFLRRVALVNGTGSIADGQVAVRTMLAKAGVARTAFDFSDGSGMSSYNRVAPRASVGLLRWVAAQPWGAAWRASLPVGGVDGTLARRFAGTILDKKLFAKTGSLNATSALSGYMIAASGRTLTFSVYANDIPDGTSAIKAMDAALVLIAAAN
ncbi:D-alanyl-D-alanine carboxypeptidase/D-alanyl-D-alanine-endopeptidase [Sphingomonas panacisoli]|uniref:D-alanyl-D-alanine carboxypeptidase/D-alanyl-D-alanine-endopeptidase n=1 Tax=Sphingomonas panacisoli TaxID=1813879 RepID=A0A5B8LK39_9SPHN|nr:D-alanyl-D-alanine carboxypeptidase/D-alanyl-D-alanine-endopeptidase [Sphingomonas panacisoli]QDZ08617.1 D-alanyl-D-alanine carboxypeptidase/D-alanyl-D-alanine-endopeptidase [Sphingomonas panacisoli]